MIKVISLRDLKIPEDRQRKFFPEAELEELVSSIAMSHGLIHPLLVRPGEKDQTTGKDTYILVAGERRSRALALIKTPYWCGDEKIEPGFAPVIVRDLGDDVSVVEAELHENLTRVNLTWQERAQAVARLHELKTKQNPNHSIGMTAKMLEDPEYVSSREYAKTKTHTDTQAAVLVTGFMGDPAVAKARSLKEAQRMVARRLEEESIQKLREMSKENGETLKKEREDFNSKVNINIEEPSFEDDFDGLGGLLPVRTDKTLTLMQGDMREKIKEIADHTINVVITDPPYGMGVKKFNDRGGSTLAHEYEEDNFEELHEILVKELTRICTNRAHVYIFCDIDYFSTLKGLFSDEWRVRRAPLVWSKGSHGSVVDGAMSGYRRSYECVLYATQGKRTTSKIVSDVIPINPELNIIHAAQKPVELYEYFLKMSAVPGDTIFDAFAGSGTIFKAAKKTMMHAIGIELSDKYAAYCELAIEE